ncbi:MAG: cyclic nucleotide-binding domain-containing protein [Deltaproteobacteria bacterium]|nr:cyclic nucleotide-binding domain-containing protein [Deltaproteobacteria bacterium]
MPLELPLGLSLEAFTQKSKLFEFLDPAGRQAMMDIAHRVQFPVGTCVVKEGTPGDAMYVILRGSVKVTVDDMGGEKQVATLGAGSFFGEMAVVTDAPRSASVTAQADLEVLVFDKAHVTAILKSQPTAREALAKMGMRRSEDTLEKLMTMDEPTPNPDE